MQFNSQCTCPVVNISQSTMLLCRTFLKGTASHNALCNIVTIFQLMHCIVICNSPTQPWCTCNVLLPLLERSKWCKMHYALLSHVVAMWQCTCLLVTMSRCSYFAVKIVLEHITSPGSEWGPSAKSWLRIDFWSKELRASDWLMEDGSNLA